MQEAINDTIFSTITCRKCKKVISPEIEYWEHLFLDTSVITDSRYKVETRIVNTLDTIATTINIGIKIFILAGIVNYISFGTAQTGHYVTFARTKDKWYEYDDLKHKRIIASNKTKITPHLVQYVNVS